MAGIRWECAFLRRGLPQHIAEIKLENTPQTSRQTHTHTQRNNRCENMCYECNLTAVNKFN